ncbi:spore coat U domain-containing protein [Sphingomonas sp.]|uniref:Csu type fimbrial protein n=1 Tax=Sphingomonas sp. TaxID=28214 RepID=UPI0017FB1303|nr:spore coat U domain-containing protein [Sphingomonas sp.]MBA3511574.1 spore coat protein U domain-containing protein [Sphingomonas sp.]
MSRISRWSIRLSAACLMLAASSAAMAACSVSTQGVSFGNYDPLAQSALDGVGNVHVSCDAPTSFTVSIGPGTGTVQDRRMTGGAAQLAYNLFKDSNRLVIWGEGIDGLGAVGTTVDLPVYGRIPATQNVQANVYADSLTVTVTF